MKGLAVFDDGAPIRGHVIDQAIRFHLAPNLLEQLGGKVICLVKTEKLGIADDLAADFHDDARILEGLALFRYGKT